MSLLEGQWRVVGVGLAGGLLGEAGGEKDGRLGQQSRPCALCLLHGWRIGWEQCLVEWEVELQRDRRTAIDAQWKYALSAGSGRRGWVNV